MAICEMHFRSEALGKQTSCNLIIPQGQSAPWATFYLLHGYSDDHTMWSRRTSIERYVEGLPILVVMPDGGKGFYCDAPEGDAFETALVRDLVGFIDATFPTLAHREGRSIGGLSMGGYGAMKLALKFPEMWVSANSHSGAFDLSAMLRNDDPRWRREMERLFGLEAVGGANDPFALAQNADQSALPALKIDCGTEDFLLEHNRRFHAHLGDLGISHQYDEFPGAHEWSYWDTHIQEALEFHRGHLQI